MRDIPVNPIDGDDEEDMLIEGDTVPEQLRSLADRLEEDDGTNVEFTAIGMTHVDRDGDGGVNGFEPMAVHLIEEEKIDNLTANETMNVVQSTNQAVLSAALDVGLRDQLDRGTGLTLPF